MVGTLSNGRLGGIPDLAPVVAAKVIGTEPIFTIGALEAQIRIRYQMLIVVFAYPQRHEGEYEYCKENDYHDHGGLILEEVAENALPI